MSLHSKANMKDLLAHGLYLLILQKSFEKITIKQICDKTGVIRGTFYNHFMDKYEALEYLSEQIIMEDNIQYLNNNDLHSFIKHSLETIVEHKDFYHKGFQIEGQNNFGEMLHKVYKKSIFIILKDKKIDLHDSLITLDQFISYHASTLVLIIRNWVENGCKESSEQVMKIIDYFYTNSLYDFLD